MGLVTPKWTFYYCNFHLEGKSEDENKSMNHLSYLRGDWENSCYHAFDIWWISNSNWTEWSTIQGEIARVISKSDEREARGRFEIRARLLPVRREVQLLINRIYNNLRIKNVFWEVLLNENVCSAFRKL